MIEPIFIPDLPNRAIHRSEFTVKRSKFITSIGHTPGLESVNAFISNIRAEFKDARHNCYAFNAGRAETTTHIGCSDDGEPKGTAGQPMLNVLTHCGIGEITIVVTRYFGGILLGTGGLVKAYQDSVKFGLDSLPSKPYEPMSQIKFKVNAALSGQIINYCMRNKILIVSSDFVGEDVSYSISVPDALHAQTKKALIDAAKGKIVVLVEQS